MRYLNYLGLSISFELLALFIAPLLVLFARERFGNIDNNNGKATEPRLPLWLSWFDTIDNSLLGDTGHKERHKGSSRYWQMLCWLERNRGYGFKWSVLAAPMIKEDIVMEGDPDINRNNGKFGVLRVSMNAYWQYKLVKQIGNTGYCWMLNFGWLLNDVSQQNALFLFSPRIARIK